MAFKKKLDIEGNITPNEAPHVAKTDKEASREQIRKFAEEESRLVKGRFRNLENPGAAATIIVRKYPGIPDFKEKMMDGETYSIPLYVARHLQGIDATAKKLDGRLNTCSTIVHGWKTSKTGFPTARDPSDLDQYDRGMTVPIMHKRRYSFESLEFENAM
jgi:hypothetical protein